MAKPNYNQQKKQRELARQARQAEKQKKRQARGQGGPTDTPGSAGPGAESNG